MNRFTLLPGAALAAWLAVSGLALAQEPGRVQEDRLVDPQGMTLYTYDKDSEVRSNCNRECADEWPPLIAVENATGAGDWSLIEREDGTRQWAYAGKPLYTYVKDRMPGDTSGDSLLGAWHIARPK